VAARARDERLLAQRRDRHEPDKLVYPGLGAGIIAAGSPAAGQVFPQAFVTDGQGRRKRFDDVAGPGPMIVTCRAGALAAAGPALAERWKRLRGRTVVVQPSHQVPAADRDGALTVLDADGFYADWFGKHGCESALVRPDWYLYGTAADEAGTGRLADQMVRAVTKR
jgi:hypothetical protein